MEGNYSKIETNSHRTERGSQQEIIVSKLEKDSFEPIEYEDMKNEEAIFEVFKAKDYPEIMEGIMKSIDNYYEDNDAYDDYPYFRVQNTCKFIPKLNYQSEILSERQLKELHAHLPYYHQYKNLKIVYSGSRDGVYLKTFYAKAENVKNSILIIKDDNQCVFGAYISEELHPQDKFYGTGETFLFTFYKAERIRCFQSSGLNDYYIYSDDKQISFGTSEGHFSLCLENDFLKGYSKTTQTFKNPPLSIKDNFFISKIELWTIQDQIK
jgi:hypothetical protein